MAAAHQPGLVLPIPVGHVQLVLDDDRLHRVRHLCERRFEGAEHRGRQHVAHVPAEEALGSNEQPAGIGRVIIEKDPVHGLKEHEIRNRAQDGAVPSFLVLAPFRMIQ